MRGVWLNISTLILVLTLGSNVATAAPTGQPTRQPTRLPTAQPTGQPTRQPTSQPTGQPTRQPTAQPTGQPTRQPTTKPTGQPTRQPTNPTGQPSGQPTNPTGQPSGQPTRQPSRQPASSPTSQPTRQPSRQPSGQPSRQPTCQPSRQPTLQPSVSPTTAVRALVTITAVQPIIGLSREQFYGYTAMKATFSLAMCNFLRVPCSGFVIEDVANVYLSRSTSGFNVRRSLSVSKCAVTFSATFEDQNNAEKGLSPGTAKIALLESQVSSGAFKAELLAAAVTTAGSGSDVLSVLATVVLEKPQILSFSASAFLPRTTPPPSPFPSTTPSTDEPFSLPFAAVLGAAVGSVILLALMAGGAYWWRYRRLTVDRKNNRRAMETSARWTGASLARRFRGGGVPSASTWGIEAVYAAPTDSFSYESQSRKKYNYSETKLDVGDEDYSTPTPPDRRDSSLKSTASVTKMRSIRPGTGTGTGTGTATKTKLALAVPANRPRELPPPPVLGTAAPISAWAQFRSERYSGQEYWVNSATGAVVWTRPEELDSFLCHEDRLRIAAMLHSSRGVTPRKLARIPSQSARTSASSNSSQTTAKRRAETHFAALSRASPPPPPRSQDFRPESSGEMTASRSQLSRQELPPTALPLFRRSLPSSSGQAGQAPPRPAQKRSKGIHL